mmetsp:Transcript_5674/g.8328  ORF Transcript_5674/g.8328 Transcript_5674/m.8328 type:complete len:572 (+) Transcript_5674:141-1856(+)
MPSEVRTTPNQESNEGTTITDGQTTLEQLVATTTDTATAPLGQAQQEQEVQNPTQDSIVDTTIPSTDNHVASINVTPTLHGHPPPPTQVKNEGEEPETNQAASPSNDENDARDRKNEERRKRYRERKCQDEATAAAVAAAVAAAAAAVVAAPSAAATDVTAAVASMSHSTTAATAAAVMAGASQAAPAQPTTEPKTGEGNRGSIDESRIRAIAIAAETAAAAAVADHGPLFTSAQAEAVASVATAAAVAAAQSASAAAPPAAVLSPPVTAAPSFLPNDKHRTIPMVAIPSLASPATASTSSSSHEDHLAARRLKDRQRYASMTPEQRQSYNAKRRAQYHRQTENSRERRRDRERARYHSLDNNSAKDRNARRARLERERYAKLSPEELKERNRKRRERAKKDRSKSVAVKAEENAEGATEDKEKANATADANSISRTRKRRRVTTSPMAQDGITTLAAASPMGNVSLPPIEPSILVDSNIAAATAGATVLPTIAPFVKGEQPASSLQSNLLNSGTTAPPSSMECHEQIPPMGAAESNEIGVPAAATKQEDNTAAMTVEDCLLQGEGEIATV